MPKTATYENHFCVIYLMLTCILLIFQGFGGQVDFIRGAAEGYDGKGKPIIAMQSTNEKTGESKIVPFLKPGDYCNILNNTSGAIKRFYKLSSLQLFDVFGILIIQLEKINFERIKLLCGNTCRNSG